MEPTQAPRNLLFDVLLPRLEMLGWVAASSGFVAKWLGYQQFSPLLICGLATLALMQFLRAFAPPAVPAAAAPWEPAPATPDFLLDVLMPKVQGIGAAVMLIGMLFKLMFWPGAAAPLSAGFFTFLTATSIDAANQRFRRRAQLLALIGGLVWAVPSETWGRQFYRHDPARQQQLIEQLVHSPHHVKP